jgi:hypothetical protein
MCLPAGDILGLSTGVAIAVGLLIIVELILMVWAILDIVQRPAVLWGQKWIWIVIVILFGIIGPIIYFAIGREQPPVAEKEADQTAATDRASHAADLLYGPGPQRQPSSPQRQPSGPQQPPNGERRPPDDGPSRD